MKQALLRLIRPGLGQLGTYAPRMPRIPSAGNSKLSSNIDWPRITIVIPTLNQGQFIGETLQSIVSQNYHNLELIVVDGGSTDDTHRVISMFSSHIAWWVSEPDSGQTSAINKGLLKASGDILAWINSDDCLTPGALQTIAEHFILNPETQAVYGHRILIDEASQEIGRWLLPPHSPKILKWIDFVPQETLYWRRAAWEAIGRQLDEKFTFAMDWDMLLRFSSKNVKIERLPNLFGLFRVHKLQKTIDQMDSIGRQEIAALRQRELGFTPKRWQILFRTIPYLTNAKALDIIFYLKYAKQSANDQH